MYIYISNLCLSKKPDFDVVLIVKRDVRCNKTPNFQNFERFKIIHFCPMTFFSRLINFGNRFFGTNPTSYLDRVDVSDQEYIYFTHVQRSYLQCNLTKTLNFGQNFDKIMVKFYPL